jgi:hypothetical protein
MFCQIDPGTPVHRRAAARMALAQSKIIHGPIIKQFWGIGEP